jgi:hypothetical protein
MLALPVPVLAPDVQAAAVLGAALLHALARDEAAGRRPCRVTETDQATWARFRGRMGPAQFLQLLVEDAAVVHPVPFGLAPLDSLTDDVVAGWLRQVPELELDAPGPDYLQAQARLLGVPIRLARADLHRIKPHQKVLELPGTGGQLSHYACTVQQDVFLQDNFTVACDSREELALAGLAALDLNAPNADFAWLDPDLSRIRQDRGRSFDFVFGLHPDKGGNFEAPRLRELFPNATVVLV